MSRAPRRWGRWPAIVIGAVAVVGTLGLATAAVVDSRDQSGAPPSVGAAQVLTLPSPVALTPPWNGRAFINDNLWTHGDLQFAVWVDPGGNPIVGRRPAGEGNWQTSNLGDLAGNPLGAPTRPDEHNVYAIAVDAAGHIHVAGNMHGSPLRYVRSTGPLGTEWERGEMVGSEEDSVSYPAFVQAPGGDLLFFYRDGQAGEGDVILNRLDAASGAWRRVATLIDGRSSGESPYLQRVAVDSVRGVVHVMFLWRSGAEAAGNRDASYLRSDDGGTTWRGSKGLPVALPVTHETPDVVAPTTRDAPLLLNQGGLAVDPEGHPHALFRVQRARRGSRSGVLHVWWDGTSWRSEHLSGLGDGRPAVVGNGRDPLLALWSESRSRDRSDLVVARLAGEHLSGRRSLARLASGDWEPTFDATALAGTSQLRVLVPVRRVPGREPAAESAVAAWSIPVLQGELASS